MSSDLPGVNPATLNGILLYYCLRTKWSGLGDSTELPRVGLSQGLTKGLLGPKWGKSNAKEDQELTKKRV
jgi:hypothetical protein